MKTTTFALVFFIATSMLMAQTTKSFQHGGITRQYKEYVPSTYTGTQSVPLVICLHGLGDNMTNFSGIGMHLLADSAQFITLYPQAVTSPYGTAWNSGASYMSQVLNGTIDDVGFINALIDSTAALYNIDPSRVYVTGFSMGGFMANRLACQLGTRVCAIASVAGTIGTSCNCTPFRPTPVAHFHGTADGTVAYTGNLYGNDAEELVDFWVANNQCDTPAIYTALPNLAADSMTVERYDYLNGNQNSEVVFYKVNNAVHTWLIPITNDISYTIEIWNFFKRFQLTTVSIDDQKAPRLSVFPNPTADFIQINGFNNAQDGHLSITDMNGKVMLQMKFDNGFAVADVSSFAPGVYFAQLTNETVNETVRFIKN